MQATSVPAQPISRWVLWRQSL